RGSKIAVSCLICSSVTGLLAFIDKGMTTENSGFLAAGTLSFLIMPYTGIFMVPINNTLFSIDDKTEPKKVTEIIETWAQRHWVRTLVGLTAFTITVFKIGMK